MSLFPSSKVQKSKHDRNKSSNFSGFQEWDDDHRGWRQLFRAHGGWHAGGAWCSAYSHLWSRQVGIPGDFVILYVNCWSLWVFYNDLTVLPHWKSWFLQGNHPFLWPYFRLVNYYNESSGALKMEISWDFVGISWDVEFSLVEFDRFFGGFMVQMVEIDRMLGGF